MDQIIYSKRFPPKERVPKMQKDENKEINSGEWERLKQVAIDFSEGYEQGIEITERRPFLWIDLFLTDNFFVDTGKKQLEDLFINANRVDLSQRKNDVIITYHYYLEK